MNLTCAFGFNRLSSERSRHTCAAVILALAVAGYASGECSSARTFGDPAFRTAVDEQLKRIYEAANGPGTQVVLFTRENPLHIENASGTELTAVMVGDSPGRIVGTVWASEGKYSIEFYRSGNKLLMVYETFCFFAESAPSDAWRNFMGLPAWESRMYFDERGGVGYAEMRGPQAPAPESAGKRLQEQAQRIVELLARSPARWERR